MNLFCFGQKLTKDKIIINNKEGTERRKIEEINNQRMIHILRYVSFHLLCTIFTGSIKKTRSVSRLSIRLVHDNRS